MDKRKWMTLAIFLLFSGLVWGEWVLRWQGASSEESQAGMYSSKPVARATVQPKAEKDYGKLIEAADTIRH
ncbi:MAG: hypothetical protein MI747_00885 [Desulfobacterales bacterium]|nr:hypothetical protein [Desulfobacterales bacterium]